MKNLLLFGGFAFSLTAFSQTVIFQDNFETANANWTLNTGTGDNQWIVNNAYSGDPLGGAIVAATPSQPASFTGGTASQYLHIHNLTACGGGIACNANFDTGSASDQMVSMANTISTAGMNNVSLSFWYLSAGASGTSYGTVEYSTNGTDWTALGNQLSGVADWTKLILINPALDNQASLKFRFRWQNGAAGNDAAFSIDEVQVKASAIVSAAEISELPADQKMVFYPNPAHETFEVIHTLNAPIEKLSIRDHNGRKIRVYDKPKPEKFLVTGIDPGVYIIYVTIEGKTYMNRLAIE